MLMLPKTFTNETLDAVTCHRGLYMFARNGHPKSRNLPLVILPEYCKIFITATPGRRKYSLELLTLGQTLRTGEAPAG